MPLNSEQDAVQRRLALNRATALNVLRNGALDTRRAHVSWDWLRERTIRASRVVRGLFG
jgi:hypothetical protein